MTGRWRGRRRRPDEVRPELDDGSGIARRTPLPVCPARGRLIVPEAVARATERALTRFGGRDGRHEGIAFWAGRRDHDDHLIGAAVIPKSSHGRGYVHVSAGDVGIAANRARRLGLAILSQVHSHPGGDTRHSDGDDEMVLMPYEGMFSLVSARYGDGGVTTPGGVGMHQFQDDRWVQVSDVERALIFIPAVLRL